jgi:hypothetical protein
VWDPPKKTPNPPQPRHSKDAQDTALFHRDPELQAMADTEIDGILLITMRHGECLKLQQPSFRFE